MLNYFKIKKRFAKEVYNKYLVLSYFVKKKYDDYSIMESRLQLELYKTIIDESLISDTAKLLSMSDLRHPIIINNIYNFSTSTGTKPYTHTQLTLASVWTIHHSLGYKPDSAFTVSFTGVNIEGIVENIDNNTTTITFSSPKSGYAYFS